MAEKITTARIVNAAVYLNGRSMVGRVKEIKLPELSVMSQEHKALGMVGRLELPSGIDKLDGEIVWNAIYPEAWGIFADPFTAVNLQARSSVDEFTAGGRTAEKPLVSLLSVMFTKIPLGAYKQQEQAEFTSSFTCTYFKQTLNGQDLIELDVLANIFRVSGVDKLATFRANLGF